MRRRLTERMSAQIIRTANALVVLLFASIGGGVTALLGGPFTVGFTATAFAGAALDLAILLVLAHLLRRNPR